MPVATTPLRVLWRPGLGLLLWRSEARPEADPSPLTSDEVPPGLAEFLVDRVFRRRVPIIGPDGSRTPQPCVVLGRSTTLALLRSLDDESATRVGGDLRYYRRLLAGVDAAVTAGAVAPGVAVVDGEHHLRWELVATGAWRSWLAAMSDRAPRSVTVNDPHDGGRDAATADFVAEMADAVCRIRLRNAGPGGPNLGDLVDDPQPLPRERGPAAASAWARWSESAAPGEPVVVFRLHLPDAPADDVSADAPYCVDEEPAQWRLEVCRRDSTGSLVAVAPHRLSGGDLDDVTSALARALGVCGVLRGAGTDPHSLDFLLSTADAEEFLTAGAATLREEGFTVLLPRSIATVSPALHAQARPVATNTGRAAIVGLDDLADFEWRLALGDAPGAAQLSQSDLDALARQQGDLVRVRGRWVLARNAALGRAARFIAEQRSRTDSATVARELLAVIAGVSDSPPPVPVVAAPGLDWLDDVAAGRGLAPTPIPSPPGLDARLRPYQRRGLDWLAHLSHRRIGGVLADDMGLGKTVQVIALLCHERAGEDRATMPDPTLVVCPMSLVGNWSRELERFAPHLRVVVHHGPDRLRGNDFHQALADADVVLTTFTIVSRDRDLLASVRAEGRGWGRIVVDEAQHVKNVATSAAKALRAIDADHRLALTGTPVENRLEDLRAVVDLVNPGLLGSPSVFKARFAEPVERDRDPVAAARLRGLTRPFILRRAKTDPDIAAGLPAKTELVVRANLTVEQASLYRAVVDELMTALADRQQRALRRRTVLAALTRLKQVCNHPAHYLADGSPVVRRARSDGPHRSGKVELLADLATTAVDEGDRMLVFTQFAEFAHLLAPWLSEELGAPIPVLHGGLPRAERDRLVESFQADDGPPLLLATLKAGGTGLNLTAANQVVHVDRWWNPAVEDQATDRAHRIGQERGVQVRKFMCIGTLEERIDEMIAGKRELAALTVSAGESWLSDLRDDEVLDLLALRDEAVSE